jgi:perosamine synthetase
MKKNISIPWAKPDFWGNERKYVNESLDSTWISSGPFIDRFEKKFSELTKSKFALAVSNGTTAIHLAFLALSLKPGDEVIVPGFGYLAAANIALQMSIVPVFCEVDKQTWCMRTEDIRTCLTPRTRAIIVVHTYGNVCDMETIITLADEHSIPVIEDTAEAFPSKYKGELAGSFGTIGTFSFQATKTITTGEGGMVITKDPILFESMQLYRSHGMRRIKHYWHELPGHNFRLTNMQAALGCAQLEQLDRIVSERKRVYLLYRKYLMKIPGILMQEFSDSVDPIVWAIAVRFDPKIFSQSRDFILKQLLDIGIECRPGFYSASQLKYTNTAPLKVCDLLASSIISLPSFPSLSNDQIKYICSALANLGKK